ncbi:MAG TPA: aminotransferase class I/II-fold pyridoxal phosphate-dependent enzyme [Humibacillus xanthopallidus]|nr:aminotransferase class I/II-fold pyridoxal phosphate-dependent enzyme [Humibacillus xanthopallidus]
MATHLLDVPLDALRRDRTSIKWRRYPADVLPLWIAEMDARPCPAVVDAVTAAMTRGDTGYAGDEGYAAALAELAEAEWAWSTDPAAMVRVTDVLTGVAHLLRLLTDVHGPVVVSPPVYNAFHDVIASIDRRVVEAPLTADARLDLDLLDATFAEVTAGGGRAAYLLSNPHNPTGTVHSAAELEGLAVIAERHGVRVLSDEIHAPLVFAPHRFTPYLTVPGSERGITVTSASKAWNLAGLKAALVVPGEDARADVARLHPFVTFGASHFGVIAQTAAYRDGREWVRDLVVELDANRTLLDELVREHLSGARLLVPDSTYLAWLDLRPLGLGDQPAATLLERGRVAVSEGTMFGAAGAGHVRVNFATSPDVLREAVARIAGCIG